MRILGPSTLISAATSMADGVADMVVDLPGTVSDVIDMIGRAGELIDRADALMARAEELVDRGERSLMAVESMLEDGEVMLDRAAGVLADSENAVNGVAATVLGAQEITREAAGTVDAVGATTAAAAELMARGEAMLSPVEELSGRAMPLATSFVDHLEQSEVDSLIGMVDKLPVLLVHLEQDILPMLGKLDQVGPDVHEILDAVHDMTSALAGLPGAGFLKRRGERKEVEGEGLAHPHGHAPNTPTTEAPRNL